MSSKLYRVNDTQRDFGSARSSHEVHQGLRKWLGHFESRSTWIDPAPKIGPVTLWEQGGPGWMVSSVDPWRKWFISCGSTACRFFVGIWWWRITLFWCFITMKNESHEITFFWCFTHWIRPFDSFWLLVSTGFWNAWATPLGFLGRLVVSIKPHVMDVSCVVAAMKTWRRCDGGKGPRGEDETNGMWAEINQFTNDFASNSNPTPLPLLFIFRKVYGNPITLISNTPSNKGTQEEYLQY